MEDNIAPHTQVGKVEIPEKVFDGEDQWGIERYPREMVFAEDLQSHNFITFGNRWFGFPTYKEMYLGVIDYFTTKANSQRSLKVFNENGFMYPVHFKPLKDEPIKPVYFTKNEEIIPVRFVKPRNNKFIKDTIEEIERGVPDVNNLR